MTLLPPYDLDLRPTAGWVTLLLAGSVVTGALAVLLGLLRLARGATLAPRHVATAGALAVAALVLVPPAGSADHLSYVAYGRIAVAGDDPYVVVPSAWRDGSDPVAGAVQPPWEETPSVYGPVATAVQAAVSVAGGDSLRRTVWAWQLVAGACFLVAGWVLDRLVRHDSAARARVAVLWTLNPVLLGQLVLGAHLDVVAVASAVGALLLAAGTPLAAGALVAVAAGVKAPYALFGLALLWGLRTLPWRAAARRLGLGLLGAGLVAVPVHLWTGPHTYDQLRVASKFVSWATPWRLVADHYDPVYGVEAVRDVVSRLAPLLAVALLAVLAWRLLTRLPVSVPDRTTADAVRAALVVALAWVLAVPYALAWYDAVVWAPLALVAGGASAVLDGLLLARLATLALVYLPGRAVGVPHHLRDLVLHQRRYTAPWVLLAVAVGVIAWAVARRSAAGTAGLSVRPPRAAPGRASSPR